MSATYPPITRNPELTPLQRERLGLITDFIRKHGRGPTTREVCDLIGVRSEQSGHAFLTTLFRKGALTPIVSPNSGQRKWGGIRPASDPDPETLLVLLSRVAAASLAYRETPGTREEAEWDAALDALLASGWRPSR